ncbi:MAG: sulfotransferase [Bacteroidota bacterium]
MLANIKFTKQFFHKIPLFFKAEPKQHIFILGKEKSGTTAIGKLLSYYTNKSLKSDIPEFWDIEDQLYSGKINLNEFYRNNKIIFKNEIIKEPGLTYISCQIMELFPESKIVMIIRDPRDNIKSVFSRLNIKGEVNTFDSINLQNFNKSWKNVLTNKGIDIKNSDPITNAAKRWCFAVNQYLKNPSKFILVKYEDFNNNKLKTISELSKKLNLKKVNDINSLLDVNYQPKADKGVSHLEFFGEGNLNKIIAICKAEMIKLGYE